MFRQELIIIRYEVRNIEDLDLNKEFVYDYDGAERYYEKMNDEHDPEHYFELLAVLEER